MDWMEAEFQALCEVISGASDFAAAFSVESILKILHDYDCADLAKFRDTISQFPSATSTSIIRSNADVQAIKNKFAREFWLREGGRQGHCAKLAEVVFVRFRHLYLPPMFQSLEFHSHLPFFLSQLNEEENRENITASPEGSTSGEDSSNSGEGGSGGSSSSSSSSNEDSNDGQASGRDDSSPKVDVTN
jgi:uncharacterized membrane protein YgcG